VCYKKCPSAEVIPLGVELGTFIRKEDAERFIEEVRGDEPQIEGEAQDRGARA